MKAVLASHNLNKLRELAAGFPGSELELLEGVRFPPEVGETYYENARAKAEVGHEARPESWVLGEDSGLEVEGLGGAPGIRSARYAPEGAEAVTKLLAELRGVEGDGRRARYLCELVALSPDGGEHRGTGILEGRIASEARGSEGFGYDPVFVPNGEEQTVAELGNEWKAEHSHRARAASALRSALG